MEELGALGGPDWFRLGDRDLATHLFRTGRLDEGATLSEVTAQLTAARGVDVDVRPVTDDEVSTVLTTVDAERLSFQEYFVARRHDVAVREIEFVGAPESRPAPGILAAIGGAERVIIAPSNPLVSIDPILAIPGVAAAVERRRADTVAVSPIVNGAALKGPADRLLRELGHEPTALGVARLYGRLAATFVLDSLDESLRVEVEGLSMRCVVTDTVMSDPQRARALAMTVSSG
jgi:LPPG:FO 2-phospho-L-lactate transferase